MATPSRSSSFQRLASMGAGREREHSQATRGVACDERDRRFVEEGHATDLSELRLPSQLCRVSGASDRGLS